MRIPVTVIDPREPESEDRDYAEPRRPYPGRGFAGFEAGPEFERGSDSMRRKRKKLTDEADRAAKAAAASLREPEGREPSGPGPDRGDGSLRDEVGPESELTWKDKYVRLLADFENHRRHAQADRERLAGVGKEAVLGDVFPVIEHLERAIQAGRESRDAGGMLAGIEMVYREFLSVLERHGVERIATVGERFDPARHEAVAMVPGRAEPEGTILEEVRPGFMRAGKLLRPASVVVAG